jgi:hypothetical protein
VTPRDADAPWNGSGAVGVIDDEPAGQMLTVHAVEQPRP